MNTARFVVALTVVNVALVACSTIRSGAAAPEGTADVLRGRALQIVDDRGRVRASIQVLPADPNAKMPDGTTGYPETVLLRLIDSRGAPNVKLAATDDGSALVLGGESNPTHVQILARGAFTSLKLTDRDGGERVIKP
jgi:hypothetical protein